RAMRGSRRRDLRVESGLADLRPYRGSRGRLDAFPGAAAEDPVRACHGGARRMVAFRLSWAESDRRRLDRRRGTREPEDVRVDSIVRNADGGGACDRAGTMASLAEGVETRGVF